jgi:peptide deformylase
MSQILTINTADALTGDYLQPKKEVAILNLVGEDNPILKEVMPNFNFDNPPTDANALASSLVETCKQHRGYGLSANQCGLRYRVFVMGTGDDYVAFFNPKIIKESEEQSYMVEGCLSFPLLGLKISRPSIIEVEYQDFTGTVRQTKLSGISARCFQHELDHMNGVLYTKKVKPVALALGIKKRNKMMRGLRIK